MSLLQGSAAKSPRLPDPKHVSAPRHSLRENALCFSVSLGLPWLTRRQREDLTLLYASLMNIYLSWTDFESSNAYNAYESLKIAFCVACQRDGLMEFNCNAVLIRRFHHVVGVMSVGQSILSGNSLVCSFLYPPLSGQTLVVYAPPGSLYLISDRLCGPTSVSPSCRQHRSTPAAMPTLMAPAILPHPHSNKRPIATPSPRANATYESLMKRKQKATTKTIIQRTKLVLLERNPRNDAACTRSCKCYISRRTQKNCRGFGISSRGKERDRLG